MDACHYAFQFWRQGRTPGDDRLVHEVLATDINDAKNRLCFLLKKKSIPRGLVIRITYETMAID